MKFLLLTIVLVTGNAVFTLADSRNDRCGLNCAYCSDLTGKCRRCNPGRWGSSCENLCLIDNCVENTCDIDTGACTYGCKDGWYFDSTTCVTCPDHCLRCLNGTHCIACKGSGKFGYDCEKDCGFGCETCVHLYSRKGISGYVAGKCVTCADGFYGGGSSRTCSYDCGLCQDGLCSRYNCTLGCKDGYYNYQSRSCLFCYPGCETCDVWSRRDQKCSTCPKGRWGKTCEKECEGPCYHDGCDQMTGQCRCRTGYFMASGSICHQCPNNCHSCSSQDYCDQCVDGWYGKTCENQCEPDCLTCETDSSICTACPSDHFMRHDRCYPCGGGCNACWWMKFSEVIECTECLEGYYLDYMEDRPSTTCYRCPTGCKKCNVYGECESCFQGFHLFLRSCCPGTCTNCVIAEKCTSCVDGYYGPTCSKQCRETCGKCSNGLECDSCKPGYHSNLGHGCECSADECSTKEDGNNGPCESCLQRPGWYVKGGDCCQCYTCQSGLCEIYGDCLTGCPTKGRFGMSCDLECAEVMPGCAECVGDTVFAMQCQTCNDGMYLMWNKCTNCPANCLSEACDSDGKCSIGCKFGWMGTVCDVECGEACTFTCNQYDCPECQAGLYGQRCGFECPNTCGVNENNDTVCNKEGLCLSCIPGYWGDSCDRGCSSGCRGVTCHKYDGTCADGCRDDLQGQNCDQQVTSGTYDTIGGGESMQCSHSMMVASIAVSVLLNSINLSRTD